MLHIQHVRIQTKLFYQYSMATTNTADSKVEQLAVEESREYLEK